MSCIKETYFSKAAGSAEETPADDSILLASFSLEVMDVSISVLRLPSGSSGLTTIFGSSEAT